MLPQLHYYELLRWLFNLNLFFGLLWLLFVVIPQVPLHVAMAPLNIAAGDGLSILHLHRHRHGQRHGPLSLPGWRARLVRAYGGAAALIELAAGALRRCSTATMPPCRANRRTACRPPMPASLPSRLSAPLSPSSSGASAPVHCALTHVCSIAKTYRASTRLRRSRHESKFSELV